jgi:hypothetical protein
MNQPYRGKTQLEYRVSLQDYLVARNSRLNNFTRGSRISTLLDAISFVLSLGDIDAINGFKYSILEGVYSAFGFPRLPGLKAVGILRIESEGHIEPINIPQFEIDLFGLKFETISAVEIPVGSTSIEIEARALNNGLDYNIQIGTIDTSDGLGTPNIQLPQGIRIWNPFAFSGGTDLETEESRLKRFQTFILNLGRSTPLGIYNAAVSIPGVAGVQLTGNVNPFSGIFELGWVNLYISDGTSSPPQSLLDLVRKTIEGDLNDPENFPGYAAMGTFVYVTSVPIAGITVEYELQILQSSKMKVEDAVTIANQACVQFINTRPIGFDVLLQQIEASIVKAHPDFYKVNISKFYGRITKEDAALIGEWLPGNIFKALNNAIPLIEPIPIPSDVSIDGNILPRTMGSSGGIVNGTAIKVVPT